ncbi:MAG: hypothetical protein WC770_06080 [Phycisphaerae bacterium]|jgi:hypothetical protein
MKTKEKIVKSVKTLEFLNNFLLEKRGMLWNNYDKVVFFGFLPTILYVLIESIYDYKTIKRSTVIGGFGQSVRRFAQP